jgi:hypothetical protein
MNAFPYPRRVLFDHLPKCGGTTVTRYLYEQYPAHEIFQIDGRQPLKSVETFLAKTPTERAKYRLIAGHLAHELLDALPTDLVSITILRNPVDRVISHYFYVLQDKGHYLHRSVKEQSIDLLTYVNSGNAELNDWYTVHFTGLTKVEARELGDEAVKQALQTIRDRYDVVGMLDQIETCMQKIKTIAGFRADFGGYHLNKTESRPALEEIDEDVISAIQANNTLDLKLYHLLRESNTREF